LDSSGASPDGAVPSAVLHVPILSPHGSPEDSLVAVLFTCTSPEFSELGAKESYGIGFVFGGGAFSFVLLSSK
jgi:hypothetical protein